MNSKKTLIISGLILLVAAGVTLIIFSTEPKAKREGATKQTAMLVDVVGVDRGNFRPVIVATGVVVAEQDVNLSSQVGGEVIFRSDVFTPGGFVKKGETLLRINSADYQNALQMRQSELHQAQADLDMEMGRQQVAKQDLELVSDALKGQNQSLVLREPQLNAVKARIESAEASVRQAELDLSRTSIRAPFDAHIINRNVNVGSQVARGENLGRLVGIEHYWVETSVPLAKLRWISFPDDHEKASRVKVRNRSAWTEDEFRTGQVSRLIGSLENQTRLARILVEVSDPLATKNSGEQPLILGAFMEVSIQGKEIPDVIRLSRDYLRANQTVWVMEDKKLQIRDVDVILQDANYAYITEGLSKTDQVVTTNLSTVVNGVRLRTESQGEQQSSGDSESQMEGGNE
jgi:RND family efflux transporter MFP subunit